MSRLTVALTALAGTAFLFATMPADAQSSSRQRAIARNAGTVIVTRDETGRTRTRILVQPRSYLDGGTEVLPGERKYMDYAIPPNYSVTETVLGPGQGFRNRNWSSPSPFDIPGIGLSF
jgi:hypothetical protein